MVIERTRKHISYQAIKEVAAEHPDYPIKFLCSLAKVSKAGYYKWLNREETGEDLLNRLLEELVIKISGEEPDMGYRRIRDEVQARYGIHVNDKRIRRICKILHIQSHVKGPHNCCTRNAVDPFCIAENTLNRDFTAVKPNEKWLTDVTEFKYYIGPEKRIAKIYLSAILDLYDRRIVSFTIGDSNNNALVFENFDDAVKKNPNAHPLFHSDRGFQYTNRTFRQKIEVANMKQSMSRVGKCLDNAPMEGFWGILKRERYYGKSFSSRETLVEMIEKYIEFYNNKRVQRKLGVITPMEKFENYLKAA